MATAINDRAYANPTKKFFVNMITRDITVEDSILDLLDNSIDSAWQRAGSGPMSLADDSDLSAYSISITVSSKEFTIKDNCGGMTFDDAVNYAFSFGRRDSQPPTEYSIGVYGIGMKRAVFKLGRNIRIRSTVAETSGSPSAFAVPISVANWLMEDDSPSWDFDIEDDERLDEDGVEIVVQNLTPSAQASFGNPGFTENLRRMIALDYLLYLRRGLRIVINDRAIIGLPIEFRKSAEIVPMRTKYDEEQNGKKVFEAVSKMSDRRSRGCRSWAKVTPFLFMR